MLKYILIIVFNVPLVLAGLTRSIQSYRRGNLTGLGLAGWSVFWLVLLFGLVLAKPIFDFLQQKNLTDSTPLSLFDVVQTTGIVLAILLCLRLYTKLDATERQLHKLNREISIRLTKK